MKSIVSKIFIFTSIVFFLIAIGFGVLYTKERQDIEKSAKVDNSIQKEFSPKKSITADSQTVNEVENLNWDDLVDDYPNIIAWINIPGTKIDYPVLKGNDNQYYLNHDYNGKQDFLGSIFMDYRQSSDFSEANTILYGHNVYIDSPTPKFGELNNYYNTDYFNSHKIVYLFTPQKVYVGEVFAVHADSADSKSNNINIETKDELIDYVDFMKSQSAVKSSISSESIDKVITLWSCTMKSITNSNGEYVDENKSRTFVSVAID